MNRELLLVAWALTGCNEVFGLHDTRGVNAGSGGPDAFVADALPASCRVTPPLESYAATYLMDGVPRGKDTELVTGPQQPALFKFGIDGIQPDEHVAAAVLLVTPIRACGITACTPCPTGATTFSLYWNEERWGESEATMTDRTRTLPWSEAFATGVTDRSERLVEGPLPTGAQLALAARMIDVLSVPAQPWMGTHGTVPMTRLSLQLVTDAPAAYASDDHDDSTCNEAAAPPSLVLTLCK